MAFKMKGPSTHQGTKRHKMEVDFSNNSPAKALGGVFGKKEEPSLGVDNPFDKPRVKSDAELSFEVKQKLKQKPQTKSQKKKLKKQIDHDKKQIKKMSEGKKYNKKGTVVSRAAAKVGKKIKQGVRQKVADVKQGIRDKKILKQKARKAADTPEKRLAAKKERRTKFADQLEYIFLDGKRPDRLAAKRQRKAEKKTKDAKIKKEEPFQTDTIPNPYDVSKIWKKDETQRDREYDNRGKQYKNYNKDSYAKEAERQQAIFDKTGKWDYKNAPKK